MTMYPGLHHQAADLRVRDELRAAEERRRHSRPPRPPSRARVVLAAQLVRLAARLADQPAPSAVTRRTA